MPQCLPAGEIYPRTAGAYVQASGPIATAIGATREMPSTLGDSPAMLGVLAQIERYAGCDSPVLISGESGTGKEIIAHAIHNRSRRAAENFLAMNVAAVPAALVGSELFGHEAGPLAGAAGRKHGLIERAHRGTLFLDNIGNIPGDLQGRLLRLLQDGVIVRVGGHQPIQVDVRVLAASNVRPGEAIAAGRLREDLYCRLAGLSVHLPPLRDRGNDIEVLARTFLRQAAHELTRQVSGFTAEAIAAMHAYSWPGNVRELLAAVRRAVEQCSGPAIDVADLGLNVPTGTGKQPRQSSRPSPGSSAERELLLHTLRESRFNISRAAQALKVSRVTLYRMMQRNSIALRQECVVHVPPEAGLRAPA